VTSELPTELGNLREGLAPIGRLLELEIAPTKATTAAAKLNRVNEGSSAEWENALVDARFQIVRKTTYALLGPIAIHKIERLVDIVTGTDRTPTSNSESIDTNPVSKPELKRRLLSAILRGTRALIQAFCWPLDYLLELKTPKSQVYYRLFELKYATTNGDQLTVST